MAVLGSINIDRTLRVAEHPRPGETVLGRELQVATGGKGANQAIAASRAGARVRMIGRVGEDADGEVQLSALRSRGVDVGDVLVTAGCSTGTAHIAVDDDAENAIVVHPGANAVLTAADVDAAATTIWSAAVLLLQLESPLDAVVRAAEIAARAGVRVVLNASPSGGLPDRLLRIADPVIVNAHEAAAVGEVARPICVTLGAHGARWGAHTAASPSVEVVDTTGAGDAFAGALAAALAAGRADDEALHAAVEAGSQACTWRGAQELLEPDNRLR